ncbi:MAG: UDP-N-acetylglucosamine 1-carboxyvinyltransferase, partial [Candidatus Paceibacteria bacterium]
EMIQSLGARVSHLDEKRVSIDPREVYTSHVVLPENGSNRIPVLLLGALLHTFDEVVVPNVAGDNIGKRPVDFHTQALEQFGAEVEMSDEGYIARKSGALQGTTITLPYPSVGATENSLFLAVKSEGETVITNAAVEPEVMELITMLRSMGAIIFTTPGREIRIVGVPELSGTFMHILGDRIEAASWAALAGATNGQITVNGIRPETLGNFLSYFREVGGGFQLESEDAITFYRERELTPTFVTTDVYPGFSTDWQQPFAILLTQAEGTSTIHETVFDDRFGYLDALNTLGAKTEVLTECRGTPCRFEGKQYPHTALIYGKTELQSDGHTIHIPDLRAGLAYIIAAAVTEGDVYVTGVEQVERGYGDIVSKLQDVNLDIERV